MSELSSRAAVTTPARIFVGRSGASLRTADLLRLRADHAAARDAVHASLDATELRLELGLPLVEVSSAAGTQEEHLRRPDLGRRLSDPARTVVGGLPRGVDLQVVLGDGLSARALAEQAPTVVRQLLAGAADRGWSVGGLVLVRRCRVGILNEVGALLDPTVAVLLVGERPGLATPASLSAYLAFRPRPGHTDADRNLVANIHRRGLDPVSAATRVLDLADAMRVAGAGGVAIKEPQRQVRSALDGGDRPGPAGPTRCG